VVITRSGLDKKDALDLILLDLEAISLISLVGMLLGKQE
jgi:hypothetical protein